MKTGVFATQVRRTIVALASAIMVAGSIAQLDAQRRAAVTPTTRTYARGGEAEFVAKSLHKALFNRDSDGSINDTINEVAAGRARQRVDALVATQEFRDRSRGQSAQQLLDQISRGLLDRSASAGDLKRFQSALPTRTTDVVMDIVGSVEFQDRVRANAGSGGGSTGGGGTTSSVEPARAASCMEQVVEHVRDDTQGLVLLMFDAAQSDGGAVKGAATDMFDSNRRLTYRCDGGSISWNYEDGRRSRNAPNEGQFPSARVRACQDAVGDRVRGQRPGDLTYESAGLIPLGNSRDAVRGLGFEKKQGGQNFTYQCTMDGTRVESASFNWR